MQLKEVFVKEQSRKDGVDYRTIYLIPEGTFYRAYVKPYRQYASRPMVSRMREKLRHSPWENREKVMASLQSYEGLLSHGRNYKLKKSIAFQRERVSSYEL